MTIHITMKKKECDQAIHFKEHASIPLINDDDDDDVTLPIQLLS